MQTDRQIYCLYTQISLSAALDSNAVPLKHYWELAEPDLDAAGATEDLLERSPRSRPSFKTATCSVVAGCPHTSRRTDERKKKRAHFQSLAGELAGPPSEHVVRELSFPSHITCYYYYHFSDTLKRLASALQVVITAQYESSNMWDVVLNNVWKQTNKVLKSPAVCYWS